MLLFKAVKVHSNGMGGQLSLQGFLVYLLSVKDKEETRMTPGFWFTQLEEELLTLKRRLWVQQVLD